MLNVLIILASDIVMSLDNLLAVGALATDWPNLVLGLVLSMALLLVCSALVSVLIERLPLLLNLASLVLGWTAAHLCLTDSAAQPVLQHLPRPDLWIPGLILVVLVAADLVLCWWPGSRSAAVDEKA